MKGVGSRQIIRSVSFFFPFFLRWFDLLTAEVCALCSCTWLGCQHWHTRLPTLLRGQAPEIMRESKERRKINLTHGKGRKKKIV